MPARFARFVTAAALAVASGPALGCSSKSTAPSSSGYVVIYDLSTSGMVTVDSLEYDDGHHHMTSVLAPTNGWTVSFPVARGGTIEAEAWAHANGTGSVMLKMTWIASVTSVFADSTTVNATVPGPFTVSIGPRTL